MPDDPDLSTTLDTDYPDDPPEPGVARPDIKKAQVNLQKLNAWYQQFDHSTAPELGFFLRFDGTDWVPVDPEIDGSPGLSAYEVAVANGFAGTAAQWLTSLAGIPGVNPLGDYNPATTYHFRDAVKFGRHAYLARGTSTGSDPQVDANGRPVTSANWFVLAEGGTDGTDGQDSIVPGTKGDPGPSAEGQESLVVSGNKTLDASVATMWELEMSGNCVFTLDNGQGLAATGMELRLYQGGSGSNDASFPNVTWITPDTGDGPGLPPAMPTTVGDFIVLAFTYQPRSGWLGYVPALGVTVAPPPDVFETLDHLEDWISATSTANVTAPAGGLVSVPIAAQDVDGNTPQLGNKRGGVVLVITTLQNSTVDPPIPTLVGAGANWQVAQSYVEGTGTNRRRSTVFCARDLVAGAAAGFTIGLAETAGAVNDGFLIKGLRCPGIVSDTWLALALATARVRRYNDAGESGGTARVTLNTDPQDAADRTLMFLSANSPVTITPESGYDVVGAVTTLASPTRNAWAIFNPTAYDITPSAVFSASVNWTAIGLEMEQGGVFTPPPAGFPPVDLETILVGFDSTDQTADYDTSAAGFVASIGSGASVLIGSGRIGQVDVITTTGTSVDPNEPTLDGGGMGSWVVAGTEVIGTSTNRRRLTRFLGRDAVAGAAAPFVIGVGGQATTGYSLAVKRTPATDAAALATAIANTKSRSYLDTSGGAEAAGGPATLVRNPLDAADSAASRISAALCVNVALANLATITPEAPLGTPAVSTMGSTPTATLLEFLGDLSGFDLSPSVAWTGGSVNWAWIATELPQAV